MSPFAAPARVAALVALAMGWTVTAASAAATPGGATDSGGNTSEFSAPATVN